jgi:hypothetical protein
MTTAIGLPWVMVVLAGLAVVAFVFVSQYLPETRHLSVEQVVEVFEQQQGASPTKGRRAAGVKLS